MYCPNCGAEISDKAKFCPICGTKIDAQPTQTVLATETVKTRKKRPIVPVLLGALVVVGVLVTGFLTNWFGLAGKQGIWVVTKMYQGDKVLYEYEYDGNGLAQKSVIYHDGDKSSVACVNTYEYENSDGSVCTISHTDYDEDGDEESTGELHSESELDRDGRVLTNREWWSSDGPLKESDLAETKAIVSTYKYDKEGNIREIYYEDPDDASYYSSFKVIGYDTYGYARIYRANGVQDSYDITYELSFSDDGVPQAVEAEGEKFTFDTDRDGNITAVYNDEGELLRQFEYRYISHPKHWVSHRNSVYAGCEDW